MKKTTTIILILILQFFLMIIFQNIYSLFKGFEDVDLNNIKNPSALMKNIKHLKNIFMVLFTITSLFFLGTAIYLGNQYKKSKQKTDFKKKLPPLQDYLLELKGSETELKNLVEKQQAHVTEKEELNKSIINNINSAVIFLNQAGRIVIFNTVAQKLFSQSYAHAKNNLPHKVLEKFPELVKLIESSSKKKVSEEVHSNQRIFFLDINPIEKIGKLLLVKDITEEKKREEINRSNSNLVMLGEMTAFLAHEIRNSLGVIYGYTKTIKSSPNKIEKVNQEINFLSSMMESFLNFSKPVKIVKEEDFDIVELLNKIANEKDLNLKINQEKIIYKSDPTLFYSVFSNLFLNSLEADAHLVEINIQNNTDDQLELLLKDNGNGIAVELQDKIWFPFFTTKDKGTGMGLAFIRKIINSLGGEISLVDSTQEGTIFKIVFYS